ncbi:phosphatidate cytidylyltransferase [Tenacibaculum holothuriorum]|uniref:Phosphatidate cytidylyltransferase n=1 Tax=Tenacibaculum holothuriorum TaxID=1635173 RepID=A0A1Y2PBR7_9FLAO|nr:phosphatidate cytidylyltransferase [Tenacibaculum holothuriorum]OSY87926.1 phosphatidate cytidylyltransferase [Tenacibaculum holothuriorum]
MRDLLTRSVSALVYAAVFITAIFFSKESYLAVIGIFGLICLWEFSKIIQSKNYISYIVLAIITALTIYIFDADYPALILGFSVFCLSILLYYLFSLKKIKYDSIQQKIFQKYIYIVLPFFYLAKLPFLNGEYKPSIVFYIILLIWTNDSFAYLVGKNFGKHKLFERVSPKKTIEGFIGGLAFAIIVGFIIGKNSVIFNITHWIVIASIVSIIGNLGDLVESKFKRQAKVKDSGTIMPGHGGLLDRLDSLFFLAPFVYLYIHYIIL